MATNNNWNNAIAAANSAITLNAGTNTVSISTDASATTVNIATGGAVKTSTFGSTNSTSATTVQSGSGALNVTATNGALTINSGTGALGISTDASATTVSFATGGAAKTVTLGSTNSTSSTAIKSGSGNVAINSGLTIDSTGRNYNTVQPLFFATTNAETSITGNGTEGWIGAKAAVTIVVNQGSNLTAGNGSGTGARFTAPIAGNYQFSMCLYFSSQASGGTKHETYFKKNNTTNYFATAFPTNVGIANFNGPNSYIAAAAVLVINMAVNDTMDFYILSTGGSKNDGSAAGGWINGYLVA